MTDQKPDSGDTTQPPDDASTSPAAEQAEDAGQDIADTGGTEDTGAAEDAAEQSIDAEATADGAADAGAEVSDEDEAEQTAAEDADAADGAVVETEAEAADAAAAGAAWTTTPVAPDPEATEAALAALAAKPEVTLEPPEAPPTPPPGEGGEPPDEGTPVLLVGAILVGAFIVALAIVLILFRPFDSPTDVDTSLSPSPVVTEIPSESPSAIPTVDTPNFRGMSLDEAEAEAADYGLVVRVNPVQTDEVESGTVLSQDPAPGEAVETGSTVELAVARPVPTSPVPDVVDLSRDEAIEAIEDAGFAVGDITEETSDEIEAGNVIRTEPEVDSELAAGSRIDLVLSSGPAPVAVPDIVDRPEADAISELTAAGLIAGDVTEAHHDTIVAGNVVSSDPAADTEVDPGSAVDYVLSSGPAPVAVPDIVDRPEADAISELTAAGLIAGDVTEAHHDTIVAGNVVSSDPAADTEVDPGSAVDYVLSSGPAPVAVPDIVDRPEADAISELTAAGLIAGDVTEAHHDTIVAGNVVSSDPAADTEVDPGSAVDYVLSSGPAPVAVPDIVDRPEADAISELTAAGLIAGDVTEAHHDTIVAGNVVSSDPAADTEVDPGSAVDYVLSSGPAPVAVPDIVDRPEADAISELTAAGLIAGDVTEAHHDTIVAGNVVSSDPAADTEVDPGSAVDYVLSSGPAPVAVPDIVDRPEADAISELTAAGLIAGDVTEAHHDTIVAGNVVSSDPAADTEVDPGSAVDYVLSSGPAPVAVPDIVDRPEADAISELTAAGLIAGDVTEAHHDTIVAGNVVSSDPAADTEVDPGSAVDYVLSSGPAPVAVPDIVDRPEADAISELTAAGLIAGDVTEAHHDTIVAGNVVSSDPAADTEVDPGSAVDYVLSSGPAPVDAPDFVGMSLEEAQTEAERVGVIVVTDPVEEFESEPGTVLAQRPEAGTPIYVGSTIELTIAVPPVQTEVPDLTGPADEADQKLSDADLVGAASSDYSDTVAAGDVISQDPAAGSTVDVGSTVSYVVSRGVEMVAVPDLTGPADEADQKLTDARLSRGTVSDDYSDTVAAGDVISQDPSAGSDAAVGSAVDYVVSLGLEQVEVPELVGMPLGEAEAAVDTAGLVLQTVPVETGDVAPDTVLDQDPAAGASVAVGSSVSLSIAIPLPQTEVPDLTGPADEADQKLSDADLVGAASSDYSDTVAAGDVISQDPAAGSTVDVGSTVSYVVSRGVEMVAVPDLTGPADEADQKLTDARLSRGTVSDDYSDTVAAGDVISQDPSAGSDAAVGSAVDYVVSLGLEQVEVPELVGMPLGEAEAAVDTAGLVLQTVPVETGDVAPDTVLDQDPAAGASVAVGSSVSLSIAIPLPQTEVPDLTGPADEADQKLSDADLVGAASSDYSDTVAAGDVISQDPAAGSTVDVGSTVSYVVSRGVEMVAVPDLTGPADEADQKLTDARLSRGTVSDDYSDTVAAGDVISQDPSAGSDAAVGSAVDYVVSLGLEQVEVPELVGMPLGEAEAAVDTAGLVLQTVPVETGDVAPDTVLDQDPAAGASVAVGSSVSLSIAIPLPQTEVPDLTGPADEADQKLSDADLVGAASSDYSDTVAAGDVISQDPAAGSTVDVGSTVSYVVSRGVEMVAVPDLTGPADEADQKLTDARLSRGTVSDDYSDTVAAGDVISQDPVAGSDAAVGSAVDYVVSLGLEQVEVPELVGMPLGEAEAAVDTAGLVLQTVPVETGDVAPDTVLDQDPAAGASVAVGSSVSLSIAIPLPQTEVPDLTGPADEADQKLSDADLVGAASSDYSDTVAAGDVISQDPAAGSTVDVGSTVSYVVSRGVEMVAVPDLTGPADEADQKLTDARLSRGTVSDDYSDTVAAGDVISQDPAAGSDAAVGSAVDYVVSLGLEQVEVPAVRDLSETAAVAAIEESGLAVGEVRQRNNDVVPAGAAVKTAPAAGETIDKGSAVVLTISSGPRQVDVPDLAGMSEAGAVDALVAVELVAESASSDYSDTVAAGDVISQDPAAGSTVDVGSTVSYVVSRGVEMVAVPDLTGPADEADQKLTDARLSRGTVSDDYSDTVAAGDVISQDPAAGSDAAVGSAVDYVVSLGVTPNTIVPVVRDLSEADAVAAIEAADLTVAEIVTQTHEKVPAGNAVKTDPAADAEVPIGTPVTLSVSTGSKVRSVPDVAGQPAAEAQATLEAADLAVTVDERNNGKVEKGVAVKTEPAAGTDLEIGSDVTLVVSNGPKQVTVPDIVNLVRAEANTVIKDAELTVGEVTVVDDQAPKNTVLDQEPAADSMVDKGSTVDYTLSAGPPPITIPDVRNQLAAEAQASLEGLGLAVTTEQKFNSGVETGNAVKTEPAAGETVAAGSAVVLTVSKGPKPVTVPDIVGLKQGAATTAIDEAGLAVGIVESVDDVAAQNTVVGQDPAASAEVPQGSAVNLLVSSGPPMVTIPDVRDQASAEAQAALEAVDLVVAVAQRNNSKVAEGNAIRTEPAAGETVAAGSDVLLLVSMGPKMAVVPDVIASQQDTAEEAISDAGLTVGTVEVVDDPAPQGTVVIQDPPADSEVPQGAAVNLAVSAGPPVVTVPDVAGQPAAEAQATLEAADLAVTVDERNNGKVEKGVAVKTEPAAGTDLEIGSDVTLVVSNGPKQVTVPDIVNLVRAEANTVIKDAELTVGEVTVVDDQAPKNTVLDQEPAADSMVDKGSTVDYTLSAGPPPITIPDVRNQLAAEAQASLEGLGLAVTTEQKFNSGVETGNAVKTEPAAGETVAAGSAVVLTVSKGPKPVTVPDIVGLTEDEAKAALTAAELQPGERSEANDEAPAGTVVGQEPVEGSTVDKNSSVAYSVSLGPVIEQMGLGGSLDNPEVSAQLDAIASQAEGVRELDLSTTPYDGVSAQDQARALAGRVGIVHDPDAIAAEEKALKRLGLLESGDDLAALLDQLYGQALPVAYIEQRGRQSIVDSIDKLDPTQRPEAAREFGRALVLQRSGSDAARVDDKSRGDEALAAYALEQGDGTATMLDWAAQFGNKNKTNQVIVPGDDAVYQSMPLLLQREYSLPFLEGRIFVDKLRDQGGWDSVNEAWGRLPESTEQILHPKLYPDDRPTTIDLDDVAGRLGDGWKEQWQQTMGELRINVWLADGQPGTQDNAKAAVKLPGAKAAAGWGGDRLVSLGGRDGQWAIVWQTKWDTPEDVGQFVKNANGIVADLAGAHAVLTEDVSGGVSNPALVLLTSSDDTLLAVAEALGVTLATPA